MKSKSPFLSKSPLKFAADNPIREYLPGQANSSKTRGNARNIPFNPSSVGQSPGTIDFNVNPTGTPRPVNTTANDLKNTNTRINQATLPLPEAAFQPQNQSGQVINMMMPAADLEGTIDTTGRGTALDASPVTRPDTTQERIDQQQRASNEERLNQGGTRGKPTDAGYGSQVNRVTGQTPDIFNDEVKMENERMGTNIASGTDTTNNILIDAGDAIGDVATWNNLDPTGESGTTRVTETGPNTNLDPILDESGEVNEILELPEVDMKTEDDQWVDPNPAVTLPSDADGDMTRGDADLPDVAQTSNVQSAIELGGAVPVDPGVGNANIPKSMGGECDTNYTGNGSLYNDLNGIT